MDVPVASNLSLIREHIDQIDRPDSSSTPEISVVLAVRNRREFMQAAIDSALGQTLPRAKYEVIVVKGFEDQDLEDYLRSQGITSLIETRGELGARVARGIGAARGKVVCFLEDDDRFLEDKLLTISELFLQDPSLVFVSDGIASIDREGNPSRVTLSPSSRRRSSVTLNSPAEKLSKLPLLLRFSTDARLSSMSLSRAAARNTMPALRELPGGADMYLFAWAVASQGGVRVESKVLTQYRMHSDHRNWESSDGTGLSRDHLDLISRQTRYLRTLELMSTQFRNTPAAQYVDFSLSWNRLRAFVIDSLARPVAIEACVALCRFPRFLISNPRVLALLPFTFLKMLFPQFVTRHYLSARSSLLYDEKP